MLVGFLDSSLGLSARIIEPDVNREASTYIINNYSNLISVIRQCGISAEKANDLLHDVYISIVDAEDNGEGFDMEFGSRIDEDNNVDFNIMNVEQFVIGRIKLYAKNNKYRNDIIEAFNSYLYETNTYTVAEIDEHGQEVLGKDGKVKTVKKTETKKVNITITAHAASFNEGGDVVENNDDLQKAYASAATADSTDDLNELFSLREQIDYCIDVCSLHNVNILNVLKNIDFLSEMLGDFSKKKKTAESVFKQISELVLENDELAATLMDVIKFSAKNKSAFNLVMSTY